MEEKNNKEKIAEESVQSNENTVAEEANNKELEINKEETTVEQESAEAEKIVETLKKCPYSNDAAIIGEVTADQPGKVVMTTEIGTQALLPQPGGELLPRIC